MDQYTAAFGNATHALFLDCRSRTHDAVRLSDVVRLVVVDTNVKHELAESAYNDRVSECRDGVAQFDTLLGREVTSLRDVSVEEFETHAAAVSRPVRDRCEHVVKENDRVRAAATALEDSDLSRFGDLMFASHESLRTLYEVSCPELDLVVRLAYETEGVVGARMTGGGFGGSVVALVHPDAVDSFAERVEERYPAETGTEPALYICDSSDGVRVSTFGSASSNHDGSL